MKKLKGIVLAVTLISTVLMLAGCGDKKENTPDDVASGNVIITETGEVIEKQNPSPALMKEAQPTSDGTLVGIDLYEPEQEQMITEEDQVEPQGYELQLVFLGDSIFDNNRDGTGVPYLTSVACEADVYNLAIGGTSATIEATEESENEMWTSRSLVGIVKAIKGDISSDVFGATRTKEILDNPDVDFSKTDYFIIEYGVNDFFRGVRQSDSENDYNLKTYAGALRYAVSNLREVAPDATIILCSPTYAQFYDGEWMVGDGNSLNSGNGTLFDYKGTCNYVANERSTEFFNAYEDLGIDSYTAEEYLEDGVHLTQEGRRLYAEALSEKILTYEETKNN